MNNIIGEKVYLKPITSEDTKDIVKWRNSEHVMNNFIMRTPLTEEMHNNWLNTKVASGETMQFVIIVKNKDIHIGSVYLRDIDKNNMTCEFGIFIGDRDYLGGGYGNESQKLILQYAFNILNMKTVYLRVLEDNDIAINMYKKNGFRLIEGKEEIFYPDGEGEKGKKILFMEIKANE